MSGADGPTIKRRISQWINNHTRNLATDFTLQDVVDRLCQGGAFPNTFLEIYDARNGSLTYRCPLFNEMTPPEEPENTTSELYRHFGHLLMMSDTDSEETEDEDTPTIIRIAILLNHAYAIIPAGEEEQETQKQWKVPVPMLPAEKEEPKEPYLMFYDIETFNEPVSSFDQVIPYAVGLHVKGCKRTIKRPLHHGTRQYPHPENPNWRYIYPIDEYYEFLGTGDDDSPPCVEQFFTFLDDYLFEHRRRFRKAPVFLYAHNGGAFDVPVLLSQFNKNPNIQKKWRIWGWTDIRGSIASLKMGRNSRFGPNLIIFKDTFLLLSAGLRSLCQNFNTETMKGDVQHALVKPHNYRQQWQEQKIGEYLRDDCLSLAQVLLSFRHVCIHHYKADPVYSATAAGLARATLFNHFFKQNMEEATRFFRPSFQEDHWFRPFYTGGRTEAFKLGHIDEPVYYADFTSLYPSVQQWLMPCGAMKAWLSPDCLESFRHFRRLVMSSIMQKIKEPRTDLEGLVKYHEKGYLTQEDFPESEEQVLNEFRIMREAMKLQPEEYFITYFDGRIQGKFKHKPYIPIKKDNRLIFPNFETPTRVMLWCFDLKYLLKHERLSIPQLNISPLDSTLTFHVDKIFVFPATTFFKTPIQESFRLKQKAEDEGNKALRATCKVIVNSIYGGFGYNGYKRATNIVTEREKLPSQLNIFNGLDKAAQFGKYWLLRMKITNYPNYVNILIASCVTAAARLKMAKLFIDIEKYHGDIFYCDTDSVITNLNLEQVPELYHKYFATKGLGYLTNEKEDGGMYAGLFVGGPKFYCLYTEDEEGNYVVDTAKIKGFYRLYSTSKNARKYIKSYDYEERIIYMEGAEEGHISSQQGGTLLVEDFLKLTTQGWRLVHTPTRFVTKTRAIFTTDPFQMTTEQVKITIGRWDEEGQERYSKGIVQSSGNITPYFI